jgi:hypothetical protein
MYGRHTLRGAGALGTLIVFILFLIFLGFLWVMTGGPQRPISHTGPFLKPPQAPGVELGSGAVRGATFEADTVQIREVEAEATSLFEYFFNSSPGNSSVATDSPYAEFIEISDRGAEESDPNKEYVVIETNRSLTKNITLTGWTLESRASGIRAPIGGAAQIPLLGGVTSETPISIGPESRVYVTTGRSPNGASFRINTCAGYFEQYQDFEPSIDTECPTPEDEALAMPEKVGTNVACIDFIETLDTCSIFTGNIPSETGSQCRDFVQNDLTYNGCINRHRNDPDFYENEWRVFLNRPKGFWNNTHDQIRLYDESGKLVASITY